MLLRAIFLIYVGFIYSLPANMIEHEGHIIESNTLIIKFTKSYSPLLGSQNPLMIEHIPEFQTIIFKIQTFNM